MMGYIEELEKSYNGGDRVIGKILPRNQKVTLPPDEKDF
jgi:hypothetical protein